MGRNRQNEQVFQIEHFEHKEPIEQISIFESRNMVFQDKNKDAKTLMKVPYYKIKEFAQPFCTKKEDGTLDYNKLMFKDVLTRYYQDKNLRLQILHLLEEIEVAIKTQAAYTLSREELGGYSYLDFKLWCDREEYCKHYLELKEKELKRTIKRAISRSSNKEEIIEKRKKDKLKYPPVWLAVDLLTFGEIVNLIELMSVRHSLFLSRIYDCKVPELISWLKCLNYVRNICAHNSNFIDLKLKTKPLINEEWNEILFSINKKNSIMYTNRIALPMCVIRKMIFSVNPLYRFKDIDSSLKKLINDDNTAQFYGYANYQIFQRTLGSVNRDKEKKRGRRRLHNDENGL